MARPKRTKSPPPPPAAVAPKAAPQPLAEAALLVATVCMVGLPVEVQVRDGSAYAGVLHTASVEGGYGVVLKKARKIVNGKDDANVPLGAFVDTLVVLPDDLVQVIAKDFSLPTKDVCRIPGCDVVTARGSVKSQTSHVKDPQISRTEDVPPKRVENRSRQGQECDISIGKSASTNCNTVNRGSPTGHVAQLPWNEISNPANVGSKDGNITNSVLTTSKETPGVKTSQLGNNSATKNVISSKTTVKESKLNPYAKVFSPSFASTRPLLAAAPSANSNYTSNSATEVPTGVRVFETNSVLGSSSLPSKIVHYNNLVPPNFGISHQYAQPIMGHNVAKLDHARTGTPYHPMQVVPTYVNPSPQPVVGGKLSPVVYVRPVSQDAMQGTTAISQGWSRPVLLNSYHASLQKFQVYVAPPVMATGNLTFVVPSSAPLVQPFQAIHPIMVPAASSMVPGKYM